jgi:hypothetical protein
MRSRYREIHDNFYFRIAEKVPDGERLYAKVRRLGFRGLGTNVSARLQGNELRPRGTNKVGVADIAATNDADTDWFHDAASPFNFSR